MGALLIVLGAVFAAAALFSVTAFSVVCARESGARIASGEADDALGKIIKLVRPHSLLRRVLFWLAAALAMLALLHTAVFRLSGGRYYAGYATLSVASGSMSQVHEDNSLPSGSVGGFPAWSLVVISRVGEGDIACGDVIAFYNSRGNIVIHRVTRTFEYNGQTYYNTRGDANPVRDYEAVGYSSVIGRYTGFSLPYMGVLTLFLQSWQGLCTLALAAYICVVYRLASRHIERAAQRRYCLICGQK